MRLIPFTVYSNPTASTLTSEKIIQPITEQRTAAITIVNMRLHPF